MKRQIKKTTKNNPRNIPFEIGTTKITEDQLKFYINGMKENENFVVGKTTKVKIPILMGKKNRLFFGEIKDFVFPIPLIDIRAFIAFTDLLKANLNEDVFNEKYNKWIEEISETSKIKKESILDIILFFSGK